MDNICAAICRMIMANQEAIPVDQVCNATKQLLDNVGTKSHEENRYLY